MSNLTKLLLTARRRQLQIGPICSMRANCQCLHATVGQVPAASQRVAEQAAEVARRTKFSKEAHGNAASSREERDKVMPGVAILQGRMGQVFWEREPKLSGQEAILSKQAADQVFKIRGEVCKLPNGQPRAAARSSFLASQIAAQSAWKKLQRTLEPSGHQNHEKP